MKAEFKYKTGDVVTVYDGKHSTYCVRTARAIECPGGVLIAYEMCGSHAVFPEVCLVCDNPGSYVYESEFRFGLGDYVVYGGHTTMERVQAREIDVTSGVMQIAYALTGIVGPVNEVALTACPDGARRIEKRWATGYE